MQDQVLVRLHQYNLVETRLMFIVAWRTMAVQDGAKNWKYFLSWEGYFCVSYISGPTEFLGGFDRMLISYREICFIQLQEKQ